MVVDTPPYLPCKTTNSIVDTQRGFFLSLRIFSLVCWLAILAVGQIKNTNPFWGVSGIIGTIWVCWIFSMSAIPKMTFGERKIPTERLKTNLHQMRFPTSVKFLSVLGNIIAAVLSMFRIAVNMSRPLTAGIYFVVLYSIGQSNFVFDRGLPQVVQFLDDFVLLLLFGLFAQSVVKKATQLPIVRYIWGLILFCVGLGIISGMGGEVPLWVIVLALLRSVLMGPMLMVLVVRQSSAGNERCKFYGFFPLIILASFASYVGQFLRIRELFPKYNEDLYYGLMGGGYANDMGLLMAMLAAIWLAKYLFGVPRRKPLDLLILVGLVSAAFVSKSLTVIYTGPLITAGCLTLIWLRGNRKGNVKRKFHGRLFVLGLVLFFALIVGVMTGAADSLWTGLNERLSGLNYTLSYGSADTVNRFWLIRYVWEQGFPTTWNLILGHGPGSFMSSTANSGIYSSHISEQLLGNLQVRYVAPSLLASRLVEYGILGTVLNLILYLGISWWALRKGSLFPPESRWLAFGFAIAGALTLPSYVLGGAFEVQGTSNMYWFLAGLVFSNALGHNYSSFDNDRSDIVKLVTRK